MAGGRSAAKTSGACDKIEVHPGGVQDFPCQVTNTSANIVLDSLAGPLHHRVGGELNVAVGLGLASAHGTSDRIVPRRVATPESETAELVSPTWTNVKIKLVDFHYVEVAYYPAVALCRLIFSSLPELLLCIRKSLPAFAAVFVGFCAATAHGFSLLGPYEDWMQPTNNFRLPGDIGGPMDITARYRWNVPFVTYGFDQSFIDFFGSNGVAAVESAIGLLDELPASQNIVVTNYPFEIARHNLRAQGNWLVDLKSVALSLMLEQMGLGQPERSMFVVRQWDANILLYNDSSEWPDGTIPNYILERNFDPQTLMPTPYINSEIYAGEYYQYASQAEVLAFPLDPIAPDHPAVAEGFSEMNPFGLFFPNLSYDDVGGLRFLLSPTNVAMETLLPDVRPLGPSAKSVNTALRPGIGKITFVRHKFDHHSGQPLPMRFRYPDVYIENGVTVRQHVERVVKSPDILFGTAENSPYISWPALYRRTDTSPWEDNAAINGNPTGAGPGVIRPPIRIDFQRVGLSVGTTPQDPGGAFFMQTGWAWFDGTTNAPVKFPSADSVVGNKMTVWLRLYNPGLTSDFYWHAPVIRGATAALESSTNLVNWTQWAVVTNTGAVVDWEHYGANLAREFLRVVPQ